MRQKKYVFKRTAIAISFAFLLIIAVTAAVYWRTPLLHAFKLATTHQPERFTELFFTDYEILPKENLSPGQSYTFPVTIRNQEGKDMVYQLIVQQVVNGTATTTSEQSILLSNDQSTDHLVSFTVPDPYRQSTVLISLANSGQSIHFRTLP